MKYMLLGYTNAQTWDDVMASGYKTVLANPQLGETEVWNIQNSSGGWFQNTVFGSTVS